MNFKIYNEMKNYKILIVFIAAILTMVSCKDFLDIDQPDIVEQEQNFQDAQTVRSSVMGIYSTFAKTVEMLFLAGEVRADLVNVTANANNNIREFQTLNFSSSNPYISPVPFYNIVVNSNEVLSQINKTLTSGAIDTLEFQSLRGELLSMRAWSNLQMLKLFGKSKYVESPMDNYPEDYSSYVTKEVALDNILSDLMEADTLLVGLGIMEWERVRISRFYINVLLGETYLEKEMYKEAADKFHEIIRKGDDQFQVPGSYVTYTNKFKLSSLFQNEKWVKIFKKNWIGNSVGEEFLFYIAFNEQYDQINDLQKWTTYWKGSYQVKPSLWITGQLNSATDEYRAPSITEQGEGNTIINKYSMDRANGIGDAGFIANRAARIHLLMAECVNRMGAPDSALMLVNQGLDLTAGFKTLGVRGRVGLPPVTPNDSIEGDGLMEVVENIIIEEMARELAFEGHRWFDLVRIAERRNDPSFLADKVAAKFPEDIWEEKHAILMDPKNWYLPLWD